MTLKGVDYRDVRITDAAALAAFSAHSFVETFGGLYPNEDLKSFLDEKFGPDQQSAEILDHRCHTRLALHKKNIVGYIKMGPLTLEGDPNDKNPRELHRLYVAEDVKGLGVSHILMEDGLDWAREEGADALYLGVWENNLRAQNFYRRYGFEDFGEHGFYVGRVRDRDLIWRLDMDKKQA